MVTLWLALSATSAPGKEGRHGGPPVQELCRESRTLEGELHAPQNLARIERRSKAERLTASEVTILAPL